MNEVVEYIVEFKGRGRGYYSRTCRGFKSKDVALNAAKDSSGLIPARVVEQRRKVIKVFPIKKEER